MSAVPIVPAERVVSEVGSVRVFARTCAAEWTRLWSVKATWWFLAVAALMMIGFGLIGGFDAAADAPPPDGEPVWEGVRVTALPVQFAILALALIAVTSDYSSGGIVPTLQWTPRRTTLFLARAVVSIAVATGMGAFLAVGCGIAAFAASRSILGLPLNEGVDTIGTIALVFACGSALSVGLGFLLRNIGGALVSVFLLLLVLPLLLPVFGYEWLETVAKNLPGSGAMFLLVGEVSGMTTSSSLAVLLGWAGGALLLGWLRLVRDDANR